MLIARRAAIARTARLAAATTTSIGGAIVMARGDQLTTTMVAPTGDRPALPATSPTGRRPAGTHDHHSQANGDHQRQATSDHLASAPAWQQATLGNHTSGATYQRVRDLYEGGITVAAEIARELGVSASYAQRTLRRVKADLARRPSAPSAGPGRTTTPERTDQATSDHQQPDDRHRPGAERSHDHPTTPDHQVTSREEIRAGDGRTATSGDRHLALVTPDHDRGEVER